MPDPYGRVRDSHERSLDAIGDDTLRGLLAMRRGQFKPMLAVLLPVIVAGQALVGHYGWATRRPLLTLGVMYLLPIAVMLVARAALEWRFRAACRRAGLSDAGLRELREHLRGVPPRLPPASAEELVAHVRARALVHALRGVTPDASSTPGSA